MTSGEQNESTVSEGQELKFNELVLNQYKEVYMFERERKQTFESRSGLFITLLSVIIGLYINSLNQFFISIENNNKYVFIIQFLGDLLYIVPLLLMVISMYFFIQVLKTQEVRIINVENLDRLDNTMKYNDKLLDAYVDQVKGFHNNNNTKKNYYNKALTLMLSSVCSYILLYLIKSVIFIFT